MADTDYGALLAGGADGGVYTGQHGLNKNSILQLIRQYGDASALDPKTAAAYSITGDDLAGVNDNPYSTVKQLSKQLASGNYGVINNANAHGAEFSGAATAGLLHQRDIGNQRNYDATQALTGAISGVQQNDLGAYGKGVQTIMDNYVPPAVAPAAAPPPAPAAPAAPAAPNFGTGSVIGQPGTPAVTVSGQVGFNPQAPQNQLGGPQPTPKTSAAAAITKAAARGFVGHA